MVTAIIMENTTPKNAVGTAETAFLTRITTTLAPEQSGPPGPTRRVPGANTNAWMKAPTARPMTTMTIPTCVDSLVVFHQRRTITIGIAGRRSEPANSVPLI